MFFEYAIEPQLVASWCESTCFNFCLRQFNLKSQRIISRYPEHWSSLVNNSFNDLIDGNKSFIKTKRKEEIIAQLPKRTAARDSKIFPYDSNLSWLENAKRADDKKQFYSILAKSNPMGIQGVTLIADASDLANPKIIAEHESYCRVERDAKPMANVLCHMLLSAKFIAFVDPYFDLGKHQFKEVFAECSKIIDRREDRETVAIEIHTSVERFFYFDNELKKSCVDVKPRPKPGYGTARTDLDEKEKADAIKRRIINSIKNDHLIHNIPIKIVVWKEREFGAEIHNRYILTDIGGVMFGHGLDRQKNARKGFDDVVCLNSEKEYTSRWNDYFIKPYSFDRVVDEDIREMELV